MIELRTGNEITQMHIVIMVIVTIGRNSIICRVHRALLRMPVHHNGLEQQLASHLTLFHRFETVQHHRFLHYAHRLSSWKSNLYQPSSVNHVHLIRHLYDHHRYHHILTILEPITQSALKPAVSKIQ